MYKKCNSYFNMNKKKEKKNIYVKISAEIGTVDSTIVLIPYNTNVYYTGCISLEKLATGLPNKQKTTGNLTLYMIQRKPIYIVLIFRITQYMYIHHVHVPGQALFCST